MAKNDWIVAGLNNPDFTPYDFSVIADMSLNNTQMLSKDEYLKSDFIKNHELFKDESGNFSNDKFNQYYNHKLMEFREFQVQEFPKGPQLDMFDTDRTKESRVKDIRFDLGRQVNPDRQAVGIEGVNLWSDPTQTKSEIAQSQKIWDTAKQEFKDYSSNDRALSNGAFDWIKQVFSDPLVMAQWEEDGEHIDPITGLVKTHKKGDYKLNDKGTYYYETLNNRSPIGKEVLSVFDTLTVDGEGINKYDFFDSDDVEKSIAGVIAKNVVSVLPLFTPLASVYSTALIAKEFSKALPMLYGFATILSDNQDAPKWINNVAAMGSKFSGSTSQYAKENTFSFENFGNLISDVALQWGQQKVIASAFNKLKGSNTYIDDALKNAQNLYKTKAKELGESEELWKVCQNKFLPEAQKLATQAGQLGRNMSMAYMAIVSNSDLYNEMRNMGLTNTEAASVALGSTLGMFALNKYTGLGEIFFDDATDDAVKLARQAIKTEMKDAVQMFKQIKQSNLSEPNKYLKYIKIASDKAKGILENFNEDLKYHTLNFAGKAVGEGLEEVSEELISDVAKEIYQLAGQFGVDTTLKDIGAWDNALERYTMSFFGGAIGGGIFYGKEALIDGKSFKRDLKNQELATLIRNGHANELRAEIEKLNKKGKLGNTKLSASKYETDENGEKVWLTTENKEESQNDAIAKAMLEKVNALEAVINNNQVGLTDEQLFENMVLTEKRYKHYEKIAPLTNYYRDFNNIVTNLIAAELDFKKASQTIEGTVNGTPLTDIKLTSEQEAARQEQLLKLKNRVDEFRKKKDKFLAGDTSLEYTRKLNFLMDPVLHSQFLSIDIDQFFKEKYGDRKFDELTQEEQLKFQLEWQEKVQSTLNNKVQESWESYKQIESLINPELEQLSENTIEYKKFIEESKTLFEGVLDPTKLQESYLTFESQLEGESDEDYEMRNTKKSFTQIMINETTGEDEEIQIEESDDDFLQRKVLRQLQIEQYNDQKDLEWANKVREHLEKVNYKVDPITYRWINQILSNMRSNLSTPTRRKDIISRKLAFTALNPHIRSIFQTLNPDLSNADEVLKLAKKAEFKNFENRIKNTDGKIYSKLIEDLISLKVIDKASISKDLDDYEYVDWTNEDGALADFYYDGGSSIKTILEAIEEKDESLPFEINEETGEYKNPEQIEKIKEILNDLSIYVGEDASLYDVVHDSVDINLLFESPKIANELQQQYEILENTFNTLISDIKTNPIYELFDVIQKQVKNPIGELIKTLSEKNGDTIVNIDEILDFIQNDYNNIDDINQLILDDQQMTDLKKVKDYMKLINGFLYAASSTTNADNPIGHNKIINLYAKKNKDKLLKEWKILPEIDSDYFILYSQTITSYIQEMQSWIDYSNANSVNKIRKFVATDRAFTIALLETLKSRNFKITLDDKEIDLSEGFVEGNFEPEITLFNLEQKLHNNFQKALKESGLTITEFFNKTGLLEKLIPSISNITKQNVSNLTDTLKSSDLTDFDLLQYFAQVLTLNPSKFYEELKGRIKTNEKVAPITAQEYATKLAQAITNKQYRDITKLAYEKSKSNLPYLSNTLVIPGVAGAGKTVVVLSSVNDPNEDAIVAGPTKNQSRKLEQSLNRSKSYTFQELLETILGTDLYNRIKTEYNNLTKEQIESNYNGEFFTAEVINDVHVIKLKKDSITFDKTITPKKLFLDEATHLNPLELQILDTFAEQIGAINYLTGDTNQKGYFNAKLELENLNEDHVFCARTPKLSISLRDNNLQKYLNQEIVRSLLDQTNESILNLNSEELDQFWTRALNIISKFNFKVYNHEEINGDLITDELSEDLINKLKIEKIIEDGFEQKKIPSTIGFIGNESSPYLQKLKESGITPKVLSMEEMQGDEFDYVIIDQDWTAPSVNIGIKLFLTDLYTTMTRARTAAIFIDNGLSSIIGKNIQSNNKSKAPSILAGVEELRTKKLNILEQFQLNTEENLETTNETTISEEKSKPEIINNIEEDFIDPDIKNIDKELVNVITTTLEKENKELQDKLIHDFAPDGEQLIEIFTDTALLGAEISKEKLPRTIQLPNGTTKEDLIPVWTIGDPGTGPLRNLQAFYNSGEEILSYIDKLKAQSHLFAVKSAIMFQHSYEDLPVTVRKHFNQIDWESGTLEIEIRKPNEFDSTHLNAYFKESGFEIDGERYIINIVFTVNNKRGQLVKFDIGGFPSLAKLDENKSKIQTNLEKRILSTTNASEKAKLQTQLNNLGSTITNYENLIKTWVAQFNNGEFEPFKLNADMLHFNQTTWFQDITESVEKEGLQLGGKIDPITEERCKDSLKLRHPELVFSPIYTFATDEETFENIDPSIKGKAVVFVSSDYLLKEDDLIKEYIAQKYNPESHTARVRMIVLDNYGMQFSQLIDPDYIELFKSTKEERKPLRQNYTGIRMFTSLWNWRASLIQFNQAVEEWTTESNYTEQQLNVLLEVAQKKYREEDFENLLNINKLTVADLENLEKFNSKICLDIPIFRLGHSESGAGFYVREEDVSGSIQYNKNKVNLLAITPQKAKQFEVLLNKLLQPIVYSERPGSETLGLRLLKPESQPIKEKINQLTTEISRTDLSENRKIELIQEIDQLKEELNNTSWKNTELIDINSPEHKRTLAGLLSDKNGKLVLQTGEINIAYADGSQWSMIPAVISNLVRTITYFQHNESELNNDTITNAKILYHDEEDKAILLKTQIDTIFSEGHLKFGSDSSLFDLCNLIFHGTTRDLHKKLEPGEYLMQLEDAYFKHGFYISPDAARIWDKNEADWKLISTEDNSGNALFYQIATSPSLFTTDVNVRTSGIGLYLNKLFTKVQEIEEKENIEEITKESEEDRFKKQYSELSNLIEVHNDNLGGDYKYTIDDGKKVIKEQNRINKEAVISHIKEKNLEVLNTIFEISLSGDTLKTVSFEDYIKSVLNISNFTVEFSNFLTIKTDTETYIMDEAFQITQVLTETPITKSVFQQPLTNGETFAKTFLNIFINKNIKQKILQTQQETLELYPLTEEEFEEEINKLWKQFDTLFKSKKSESEIITEFNKILNNSSVYSIIDSFIDDEKSENNIYLELRNIIDGCKNV